MNTLLVDVIDKPVKTLLYICIYVCTYVYYGSTKVHSYLCMYTVYKSFLHIQTSPPIGPQLTVIPDGQKDGMTDE